MFEMKHQIQEKVGLTQQQFDLIFDNKRLDDDRTVKDYGLQPESTVNLRCRLEGGGGPLRVSTDGLAPEFDIDFTYVRDNGKQYKRGGFEYKRPYGWNRFAVRVLGRYENDLWLGADGDRTEETSGESNGLCLITERISKAQRRSWRRVSNLDQELSLVLASTQVQALKWLKGCMRRNSFTTENGSKLLFRVELSLIVMVTLKSSVLRKLE